MAVRATARPDGGVRPDRGMPPNRRRRRVLPAVLLAAVTTVVPTVVAAPAAADGTAAAGGAGAAVGSGRVTTDFRQWDNARAVALQPDGKIVVVGSSHVGVDAVFAVARYLPDGRLDPAFGTGGKVTTAFPVTLGDSGAEAVQIQPDGRILVAGARHELNPRAGVVVSEDIVLARYTPTGALDPTFGTGGKVVTVFPGSGGGTRFSWATGLALQPDGRILVGGLLDSDFLLARYTAAGVLDGSFGTGGVVTVDFAGSGDFAFDLAVQADGRPVLSGRVEIGRFGVSRHLPTGELDPTFGAGGRVSTFFVDKRDTAGAVAVAVQSDGRIVTAGRRGIAANEPGGIYDIALARWLPTGALDPAFGRGGKVSTDFGNSDDLARDLVLQPDSAIVVGGTTTNRFAVVRYRPNGTLDPGFGTGGLVVTDFGTTRGDVDGVAVQPDGRIVAVGVAETFSTADFAVARYLPNGAPDPAFGG